MPVSIDLKGVNFDFDKSTLRPDAVAILNEAVEILKRYEKWKDIAMLSGPQGLRAIKGFRDESLSGEWNGFRSSRLNEQWRVIYSVEADVMTVQVVRVTPHDYRKR